MNQPYKALLVDDEFLALQVLEQFVGKLPDVEIFAKTKSSLEALRILQQEPIDILFLDIQMPNLSGNNLLKALLHPPVTIFTTAYSEYAVEAFSLNAVDYLLKPFSFPRFLQAVNKAKVQLQQRRESGTLAPSQSKDYLSAKIDGKWQKIYFHEIMYIEGLKEYIKVVSERRNYVLLDSMKRLEGVLPPGEFMRIHKSYIVAKSKVTALNGYTLELSGHKLPISRAKKEEILKQIF